MGKRKEWKGTRKEKKAGKGIEKKDGKGKEKKREGGGDFERTKRKTTPYYTRIGGKQWQHICHQKPWKLEGSRMVSKYLKQECNIQQSSFSGVKEKS